MISFRNLYIARMVLTGMTQKEIGKSFGITGCRVGVLAHDVCRRLIPKYYPATPNRSMRPKPRSLKYYQKNLTYRMFKAILDYEKGHYATEREVILDVDTTEEAIIAIKELT